MPTIVLFAILPPEMRHWPPLLWVLLLAATVFCLSMAFAKKSCSPFWRVCLGAIGSVLALALLLVCLSPSVARVERLYYQGHDQFYWDLQLHSSVPSDRREAAMALAAMLRSSKSDVRGLVIQELGDCATEEREIALSALLALCKDDQESEYLRWKAEYAIGIMFFQHVVGDIGSEVERERYQKIILAEGWEAAAQDIANKRKAKAQ